MVARLLGVSSPIGKDLDSLADVVSFGLAPAVLVFHALDGLEAGNYLAYGVFIIPAFAALRLAKFNNDTRQTTSFRGLPVPSNALFWLGATAAIPSIGELVGTSATGIIYLVLSLLLSLLMVGELPMFSFKLSKAPLSEKWPQLALIIIAVGSVIALGWIGCSVTIIAYLLLSLVAAVSDKQA